jgi:PPP family 3-phenylpropionic acid transporter
MIYAVAGSFASVFMLEKGYNNTHIGMTLAAANLLALLLQPFVADRMDRAGGTGIMDACARMLLIMMITGAGYYLFAGGSFMLAASIVILLAVHALIQPELNSLAFRLSGNGINVSFGIGRAGGSLGYSAILAVLGTLVERRGAMVLPAVAEAACLLTIIFLLITKGSYLKVSRSAGKDADTKKPVTEEKETERINLSDFIRRNRNFFIMNLGVAGLFFSNAVLSNYMAQIAGNIGGSTEQVGRILSLMAFCEMPTMIFFDRIRRRFSSRFLIKLAALGFTGKMAVCWLAGSVSLLYFAQFFQLIAFAMMMPGMVYFIDEIMSPGEAVKGQALFTMMITLSTVAASFAGGWLIDVAGVSTMNLVSVAVTALGAVIVIFSINKVEDHRQLPRA